MNNKKLPDLKKLDSVISDIEKESEKLKNLNQLVIHFKTSINNLQKSINAIEMIKQNIVSLKKEFINKFNQMSLDIQKNYRTEFLNHQKNIDNSLEKMSNENQKILNTNFEKLETHYKKVKILVVINLILLIILTGVAIYFFL